MTDFYVMLGLARTATAEEIRAAYLERMKVLHPDRHAPSPAGAPSAADLNQAYWILRDAERRAAYDRLLAPLPPTPRRRPGGTRRAVQKVAARRVPNKRPYYPRRSSYSGRTRALAAVVLVLVSAAAGAGTMMLWRSDQAQAAWARIASATEEKKQVQLRALDETLAGAAQAEFHALFEGAGFPGASLYGRQCFDELAVQPNAAMADYCLAFDRMGAEWENALITAPSSRRYFDARTRIGRYRQLANRIDDGPVRQALVAEAAFLTGS
jgi:curved DNA-binding protein CbpA